MPDPAALMLERGGVALADSADASRCYPCLWPSPAAARQAFHRARRVTGTGGAVSEAPCHAPLRRATYQRAGAGKRPASLVYDPAAVADLRSWLEERVGPLARFELDASGGAPAPVPAAGPGGADVTAWRPAPPDRIRLSSLAQRLRDARPKRRHGVRELDWSAWEAAGRDAAGLPGAAWSAWRNRLAPAGGAG